ncbi:uroporphyrinogen-III synthase [Persephonella sp.]
MKILITREKKQAEKTAKKLEKEGFEPILFPTITFQPVEFDTDKLGSADVVVFTSQNGVRFLLEKIPPEKLRDKILIATGEKTKKALEKAGLKNVLLPEIFSSEGVAQLLLKNEGFRGKRVVFVRPVEGIDTGIKLLEGFMEVSVLPVYKTVENYPDNREMVEKMLERGEIDFVLFTSPSTLRGFIKNFPDSWRNLLKKTRTAVIGTTTAQALEKEGIKPDLIPEVFTLEGVIEKLRQQAS